MAMIIDEVIIKKLQNQLNSEKRNILFFHLYNNTTHWHQKRMRAIPSQLGNSQAAYSLHKLEIFKLDR